MRYYAGDWDSIRSIMPEFDLVPFRAGYDEPANPFLQTVMRRPLSATERPIPVGVVSHNYTLASHRDVAALCRKGLVGRGIDLLDSGIAAGDRGAALTYSRGFVTESRPPKRKRELSTSPTFTNHLI